MAGSRGHPYERLVEIANLKDLECRSNPGFELKPTAAIVLRPGMSLCDVLHRIT